MLAALPKSAHPGAKAAMAQIYQAEDKAHARTAAKAFADALPSIVGGPRRVGPACRQYRSCRHPHCVIEPNANCIRDAILRCALHKHRL